MPGQSRHPTASACNDDDMEQQLGTLLREHLRSPTSGVSIGGFGALAEFQDAAAVTRFGTGDFSAVSPRGALRIVPAPTFAMLAYETLSASRDAWQCGIALTTHAGAGAGPTRRVLTELGPDVDAIRAEDAGNLLFDLGVGLPNVDYCIRTADGTLIDYLRAHCGSAVTAGRHPVLERMIDSSPHRVALSAAGRIEVYQRIDRHQTPAGPHTHLLPDLLARRRTHSANVPLPRGTIPLLTLHPEHPLHDAQGRRRHFARPAFEHFEAVLEQHGLPGYYAEKQRLRAAVATGANPAEYALPSSRPGRLAMRIALRQMLHVPPITGNADVWLAHCRR